MRAAHTAEKSLNLSCSSVSCSSVSWQCLLDLPYIPIKAPCQAVKPVSHVTSVIDARNRILRCRDDNTGGGGGGEGEGRRRGGEGRGRRRREVWHDYCMQCSASIYLKVWCTCCLSLGARLMGVGTKPQPTLQAHTHAQYHYPVSLVSCA